MGASASSPSAPAPAAQPSRRLGRSSEAAALSAALDDARAEAGRHRSIATLALQEAAALREEHEQVRLWAPVGAAVVAAFAAATTFVAVRRRQAAVLAEASQMVVDLRTRGAPC